MEDYGFSSNLSSAYSRKLVICCGTDGLERTGPWAAVMEIPQGGSREQVSHKLFFHKLSRGLLAASTSTPALPFHACWPRPWFSLELSLALRHWEWWKISLGVKDFQVKSCMILGVLRNKEAQVHTGYLKLQVVFLWACYGLWYIGPSM